MQTIAAIPDLQSAINLGGGEGDAVRLKLDLYLSPDQVIELMQMRGREITITLE